MGFVSPLAWGRLRGQEVQRVASLPLTLTVFLEAELLKIALVHVKVCVVENVISWKCM